MIELGMGKNLFIQSNLSEKSARKNPNSSFSHIGICCLGLTGKVCSLLESHSRGRKSGFLRNPWVQNGTLAPSWSADSTILILRRDSSIFHAIKPVKVGIGGSWYSQPSCISCARNCALISSSNGVGICAVAQRRSNSWETSSCIRFMRIFYGIFVILFILSI